MNIPEERRKLTATWLNSIGSGAIVTGFIAPTVATALNLGTTPPGAAVILVSLAWLTAGCALHWLARRALGGRRDDPS